MRISYFTDTEEIGGAERYLADLAAAAGEAGHEVTMMSPQPDVLEFVGETVPEAMLVEAGTREHHRNHSTLRRSAAMARAMPGLRRELARAAPDILHVNNGGYPGSDLCRLAPLAARTAGVGTVAMTVHSMPWERSRDSHASIQSAADLLVRRTVDVLVCPAMMVADSLVSLRSFPAGQIRHIRYGAREPGGGGEPAERLRQRLAPSGELLVGMVSARPRPEKGYDVFVEAIAQAGPGVRGALVGPDPDGWISELISSRAGDRISFEGPQPAVDAYYHAFDVVVVPSTAEECMPFVILEAMAASTPAFASRLAGTPEAIDDPATGRLFTPGSTEELGRLIDEAAADGGRAELAEAGARARTRWESLFSPTAVASETLALYDELLGAPSASAPPGDRKLAIR